MRPLSPRLASKSPTGLGVQAASKCPFAPEVGPIARAGGRHSPVQRRPGPTSAAASFLWRKQQVGPVAGRPCWRQQRGRAFVSAQWLLAPPSSSINERARRRPSITMAVFFTTHARRRPPPTGRPARSAPPAPIATNEPANRSIRPPYVRASGLGRAHAPPSQRAPAPIAPARLHWTRTTNTRPSGPVQSDCISIGNAGPPGWRSLCLLPPLA